MGVQVYNIYKKTIIVMEKNIEKGYNGLLYVKEQKNMLEIYVLVMKKPSIGILLLNALVLALAIVSLLLSCTVPFAIILAVLFAGIWYFIFMETRLEYEYSYFDGEARFAKIMNKSRRKKLQTYSLDEVIMIAPAGDRSVMNYENNPKIKRRNYTSRFKNVPYYDMVVRTGDGTELIKFEPDDAYLDAVCVKYSQKVVRRQTK